MAAGEKHLLGEYILGSVIGGQQQVRLSETDG